MTENPFWVRAGITRRGAALLIDYLIIMVLTQALVASVFDLTGGRIQDSGAFQKQCSMAKERPVGVSLPAGFTPTGEAICISYFFSKPVARSYVFERKMPDSPLRQTVGFTLDTTDTPIRAFDFTLMQWPLLAFLRWALERHGWRSPGRLAAGLQVVSWRLEVPEIASGKDLTIRYLLFAAAGLPAVGFAAVAVCAAWLGFLKPSDVMMGLLSIAGWLPTIALVAAVIAIFKRRDSFYDQAARTRVVMVVDPQSVEARSTEPPSTKSVPFSLRTSAITSKAALGLALLLVLIFAAELVNARLAGRVQGFSVDWQTGGLFGGVSYEATAQGGQWYRLATSSFLHWSLNHLATNLVALLAVGVLLEPIIGAAWFVAIFLLSGLAGAGLSIMQNLPNTMSMGASGAILGLMAAGLILSFRLAEGPRRLWLQTVSIVVLGGSLAQGSGLPDLGSDHASHLGGALAGSAVGAIFMLFYRSDRLPALGRFAVGTAVLASAATAASIPSAGFGDFSLDRLLVPAQVMPKSDAEWGARANELARRYPRDPRVQMALALAAGSDVSARDRALQGVKVTAAALRRNDQTFALTIYRNALKAVGRSRIAAYDFVEAKLKLTEALAFQLPLDPELLYLRADAEQGLGEWSAAKDDLQKLLAALPGNVPGWIALAFVMSATGDQAAAINFSSIALLHDPKSFSAHRQRGWFSYLDGRYERALVELEKARELDPKDHYAAIWVHLASLRAGLGPRIDLVAQQLDLAKWPGPVMRYLRSEIDVAALRSLAASKDAVRDQNQRCEANFYIGENLLAHDPAEAATNFRAAREICPKRYYEWVGAGVELFKKID